MPRVSSPLFVVALVIACNGGIDPSPGLTLPPTTDPSNASADPTADTDPGSGEGEDTTGATGGPNTDCDEPSSVPPVAPSPACAPDIPCVDATNCPDGHTCNTALSPPECTLLYCGAAGTPCHDESACQSGLQCFEGRCNPCDFCGDLCAVDFASDPQHCGCCDMPVPDGGQCNDGVAGCPPGQTLCGDTCADLNSDPEHCGSCDNAVEPGLACVGGEPGCEQPDFGVLTLCGSKCVDLMYDDENCGACGASCHTGSCAGGDYCAVHSETTDPCKNICAAAGMACTEDSVAHSSASYYGWCDGAKESIGSCTEHPADEITCGSNPSCICTMKDQECGCVPN